MLSFNVWREDQTYMFISIIIPTFNEGDNIRQLVNHLRQHGGDEVEIIVSDGGSTDDTVAAATGAGAKVLISPQKGRAGQLNHGGSQATGDVLYFVHADTFPPATFVRDIKQAVAAGYNLGRYSTKFNSNKLILRLNAWFTRFDWFVCMGGDQTLFIAKSLFTTCSGFNAGMLIMEDFELCQRARKFGKYKIMKGSALVSARKYNNNSWWRVQVANATIVNMYKRGASQQQMVDRYQTMISYRKSAF